MENGILLRPAAPADDEFLFSLFRAARSELAALPGGESVLAPLLRMQFRAQSLQYEASFPQAVHRIVMEQGKAVGRLLVASSPNEVRLVDIALLPEARNRGIGTRLVSSLMADAAAMGRPLRLQVWKHSPAVRFYQRLGFQIESGEDPYLRMRWEPAAVGPA
jgi:ribosomal protein S18 acetylase RimI-like enzyme